MKVTKQQTEQEFKPVNLNITFTTAKELDAFTKLICMDVSIPNHLVSSKIVGAKLGAEISNVMYQISKELVA